MRPRRGRTAGLREDTRGVGMVIIRLLCRSTSIAAESAADAPRRCSRAGTRPTQPVHTAVSRACGAWSRPLPPSAGRSPMGATSTAAATATSAAGRTISSPETTRTTTGRPLNGHPAASTVRRAPLPLCRRSAGPAVLHALPGFAERQRHPASRDAEGRPGARCREQEPGSATFRIRLGQGCPRCAPRFKYG
jgi:hypothetical protein